MNGCKQIQVLVALRPADRTAAERAQVEAHLAACAACAARARAYAEQDRLLHALSGEGAASPAIRRKATGLGASSRATLDVRLNQERRRQMFRSRIAVLVRAAAVVLLVMAVAVGSRFLLGGSVPAQEPPPATAQGEEPPIVAASPQPTLAATVFAPSPLAPAETGLVWKECAVGAQPVPGQAEQCFGKPLPKDLREDQARRGKPFDAYNLRLAVGEDTYETVLIKHEGREQIYVLRKNGHNLATLGGETAPHYPNVSLQYLAGQVVWEFSNAEFSTLLIDGEDVRELYGLDAAYDPYELGGKLIFIGQQGTRQFVVYAGRQVGPDFASIGVAQCCEDLPWSVKAGSGRYVFWGQRADGPVVVELTAAEQRAADEEAPWLELDTPVAGQVVSSTITFAGRTNHTPDNTTLYVYLYDEDGLLVTERWVQIAGQPGEAGTFSGELPMWRSGRVSLVITADGHQRYKTTLTIKLPVEQTRTPGGLDVPAWTDISPDRRWRAEGLAIFAHSSRLDEYYTRLAVLEVDGITVYFPVEAWRPFGLGYTIPYPVGWSADGNAFYFTERPHPDGCVGLVNGSDLQRLDLRTGDVTEVLPASLYWLSLSPDGETLVYVPSGEDLVLRDLASGEETPVEIAPGEGFTAGRIVWSPDGTRLALTLGHRPCEGDVLWGATSILVVDVATGKVRTLLERDARPFVTMLWDEEGVHLLHLHPPDILHDVRDPLTLPLWLLNPDTGELTAPPSTEYEGEAPGIIAYLDHEHRAWLVNADGSDARQLELCDDAVQVLAWSPDGRGLGYVCQVPGGGGVQGQAGIYNLATQQQTPIGSPVEHLSALSWSPDGCHLALDSGTSAVRTLRVINVTSRRPITTLHAIGYDWSPEGDALLLGQRAPLEEPLPYEIGDSVSLAVLPLDAQTPTVLLPGTSEVTYLPQAWLPDGRLRYEQLEWSDEEVAPRWSQWTVMYHADASALGKPQPASLDPVVEAEDALRARLPVSYQDVRFSWSPDGRWVVFSAGYWPETSIYLMEVEGEGPPRKLRSEVYGPLWQPAPKLLRCPLP